MELGREIHQNLQKFNDEVIVTKSIFKEIVDLAFTSLTADSTLSTNNSISDSILSLVYILLQFLSFNSFRTPR